MPSSAMPTLHEATPNVARRHALDVSRGMSTIVSATHGRLLFALAVPLLRSTLAGRARDRGGESAQSLARKRARWQTPTSHVAAAQPEAEPHAWHDAVESAV